ncbi:hypothetical protein CK203_010215 [Vitis vinifera]|uniref:Uncharacterized protein n=1 Tax=Vitis vinifera TaxID=29760 RepID=A0A438JXT4_VITVI|nr:hypothetical protein CK203_010215 [Vitis vinifera]
MRGGRERLVYYGLSRGEPLHLHPCCAKLPFKRTDNGSIAPDLKENITSGEVEEGKEEECGDQKQSVGTEASRGALTKELTTQI